MKLFMIRHGATAGNLEKRYVGRTDEGLTEQAVFFLQEEALKLRELAKRQKKSGNLPENLRRSSQAR